MLSNLLPTQKARPTLISRTTSFWACSIYAKNSRTDFAAKVDEALGKKINSFHKNRVVGCVARKNHHKNTISLLGRDDRQHSNIIKHNGWVLNGIFVTNGGMPSGVF